MPGYRDGAEPYGEFPATQLLVPDEWVADHDSSFDVAIAELGVPLEDSLGARGIAFNKAPSPFGSTQPPPLAPWRMSQG